MKAGQRATILATVWAWGTGSSDNADFYYSTDDDSSWTYIGTKKPTQGGENVLSIDYELPEAQIHRVRVNYRYNGSVGVCSGGNWDESDDLVFSVATDSTTNAPVTPSPVSSAPTKAPVTPSPTRAPSKKPTRKPTKAPTNKPTIAPTTKSPTASPVPGPTSGGNGPQNAVFDSNFGAPVCASVGNSCSSLALLNGRGTISNGNEPNKSNTLDGCQDGNSGSYHSDESIDKVIVRAGDIDAPSNDDMKEGDTVTIVASIWAWNTGASDRADFYYASDASDPEWQYIGTLTPPSGGANDLMMSYSLPQGNKQAVRVQFRYGGSISKCSSGSYNDRDDVVFTVGGGTPAPTQSPVISAAPTPMLGGGPQEAVYDSALGAPRCLVYGSKCDSLNLVNGRGTMYNGNESNRPNTLDTCKDGNSGSYHGDESIDRIVVVSGEIDGTGSGLDMVEGGRATIIATVWPWNSGSSDYADFYYASDSSNPQWVLIGTKQPTGSGLQEIKMSYNLPSGVNQAIRVNFRYRGVQGSTGACSSGSYDDNDDLAFRVKSNPSFVEVTSQLIVDVQDEAHDVIADSVKRTELDENKGKKRASKSSKRAKRA
jgi:hypothetical protein